MSPSLRREQTLTATSAEHAAPSLWVRVGEVALAAGAYFVLARCSLLFASLNPSATPIWPPTGLAIALVLVRGNIMLAAVLMGALAANFAITPSLVTAGLIAAGNTAEAYVASLLLRRWADGQKVFYSPTGIAKFAVVVIGAAAPVSATIGVTALAATGYAPWPQFGPVWTTWWLGDLAGAILATPALILWARTGAGLEPRTIHATTALALAAAALIGVLTLSPLSPFTGGVRSALSFLAILPLLWSALRLGLRDTATVALLMSSLAIWGAIARSGPFTQATLNDTLLMLVAFIVAVTLPSLALAAERRETQATLRQTRHELAQSQKLEALGQLTGTVAHDFNNLVAAMTAGLSTLSRQEEERNQTLAALGQTLQRASTLTRQLLAFARREPLKMEVVALNEVMSDIEALIKQSVGPGVNVDVRMGAGLWPVRVNRSQLDLALLNLALNARDAMPNGGSLRIQVDNLVSGRKPGVAIEVSDTGVGMNADVLERAFEPFFSTKPPGSGTGLGLAQVYGFAQQSGGDAQVESEPGRGAIVTITLPRA
jgi:signal transduction histidine kinase